MICYEAKCKTCGNEGKLRTYHGETARNLYTRSKEHYSALRNQDEKSFMNKLIVKEHGGKPDEVEFDWKIIGKFKKPLSRQLTEAIRIDKKSKDDNLNSKNEYFRHTVKRISLSNSDSKEECGYCGKKLKNLDDLQIHEKDFHTQQKCPSCSYVSYGQKGLTYHMNDVHSSHTQ